MDKLVTPELFSEKFAAGKVHKRIILEALNSEHLPRAKNIGGTVMLDLEAFTKKYGDPQDFKYFSYSEAEEKPMSSKDMATLKESWENKIIKVGARYFVRTDIYSMVKSRRLGPEGVDSIKINSRANAVEANEELKKRVAKLERLVNFLMKESGKTKETVEINQLPLVDINKKSPISDNYL